ncbi:ligase-associated DNA damage response endonuclease PdeM [Arcticibacter eurypsychrophilus]|uniref:ligase-associated DNA damage response endonuclease PdeM n=1 Tax=Arcticibacter eurypsychrophilus TaxID=1434752 RepID=UPI00084CF54C|nr:ligase-associated DNA damage response endonuclease PdeM [Arcticibacter eurypsychrophilus]
MIVEDKGLKWELLKQHLVLLSEKGIFWEEQQTLIVSDLHIGKVGHFRNAGIAIPKDLEQEELAVLSDLIAKYNPKRIIFLGDLFHSEYNDDWNWLMLWTGLFPNIQMVLVKGNHDVLNHHHYSDAGFIVMKEYIFFPFKFIHEPLTENEGSELYCISGHIHPAVKLKGKGKQSLTLSCFYFNSVQAVIPAFGKFTGNYCIEVTKAEHVFGILNNKVLKL